MHIALHQKKPSFFDGCAWLLGCRDRLCCQKRMAGRASTAAAKHDATKIVVVAASEVFADKRTRDTPPAWRSTNAKKAVTCPTEDVCHSFRKTENKTISKIDATICGTAPSMTNIILLCPNYVYSACHSLDKLLFTRTALGTDGRPPNRDGPRSAENQQTSGKGCVRIAGGSKERPAASD